MKRLSFVSAILVFVLAGYIRAQEAAMQPLINYKALENKLKKSNNAIEDPKKNIKAKTWMSRGELLMEIYTVNLQYIRKGMPSAEAKLFFKEPNEIKQKQEGSSLIEEYIYERLTLTFRNDSLIDWLETKKIAEDPLFKAKEAFIKVEELDTEGKLAEDLAVKLDALKLNFENEAVYSYTKNDYKRSVACFKEILAINEMEAMGNTIDTIIFYNAGRVEFELEDYEDAIEHFEIAKKYNHPDPFLYKYLYDSYVITGDTVNAMQALKDGFKIFPENQTILIELINYYLTKNKSEEALEYLAIAKEDDPENISFYFAEGTLYDRMGLFEEAKKSYEQCIMLDDQYFNAFYNLGVMYYNRAVLLYEKANEILDNVEYEKAKKLADDELYKAVPYMEQAHTIDPDDIETLRTLKTMYYRLQVDDKYDDIIQKLEEKGE
jgi:tetratricopeptide (TPR) repeat protein